jgi:hypothetical protein
MWAMAVSYPAKMIGYFLRLSLADAIYLSIVTLCFFARDDHIYLVGIVEIIDPGWLVCNFHGYLLLPLIPEARCSLTTI